MADHGAGHSAVDVMVRHPAVLPAAASVDEVRRAFVSERLHMALLTEGDVLVGTVVRSDLPPHDPLAPADERPALSVSRLEGRTVAPDASAAAVLAHLVEHGLRRTAVVDDQGRLLGLLCLTRRLTRFCTDEDVAARAADRHRDGVRVGLPGRC